MGQTSYTEMLQNHGKAACKAMSTPAKSRRQVSSLCRYRHDQQAYQVIIGSLLYLSATLIQTLHMLLNCVARFWAKITKEHWKPVMIPSKFGLLYKEDTSADIVGYSNADWAGDIGDWRSTSGYGFSLEYCWQLEERQTDSLALSAAKAEYIALSLATLP